MSDKTEIALALNQVSFGYQDLQVLNNLSVAVKPGEFVVLVGPSGCGKSTLLNILSGNLLPENGDVFRTGQLRTVYQQDGLFPWLTVAENIQMGLRFLADNVQKETELQDLLALVHLNGFEHHYPHQLSGGMRQRVELARVLAGDADILLMDEPFSSLDYQSRLKMRFELLQLLEKRPKTVIFVTHDIEEATQLADRILVLSNRPASVLKEIKIDSAKPRDLSDPHLIAAMKMIIKELGLEATHKE